MLVLTSLMNLEAYRYILTYSSQLKSFKTCLLFNAKVLRNDCTTPSNRTG